MQPSTSTFQKPAARQNGSLIRQAGYAGGGEISPFSLKGIGKSMGLFKTPEEKLADRQAEYAKKQAAAQPVATAAPTSGIGGYVANNALDKRMAAAGLKNGGMIKGPGTPTSDSIPAQVQETGEPIKVSTGERIVSASQNSLLEKIAKARGYKSVDQMFEAETGKPVGPTIKGGQKAAATGLDAQAESDRKALSGAWNTAKDVNQRAGAVIADVATAIPRGLAGAYDSAVIRPMRAAGINAGYMSPLISPTGADPSSMTPFYDKIRAQDAAQTAPAGSTPSPTAAPTPTTSPAGTAGYQGKGYLDPRRTDIDTGNPALGDSRDMTKELSSVPKDLSMLREGQIYKTVGKNGSPIYSGVNVGNDAQMVDGMGKKIDSRGTLSVMPSTPSQVGSSPAVSAALQAAMARGDTAAVQSYYHNQGQSFNGVAPPSEMDSILNRPMNKSQRAAAVELARIKAGQPLQQAQIEASNASTQGSLLKTSQDKQLLDLQKQILAETDPAKRSTLEEKLRALSGKTQAARYAHTTGGQVYDPATGQNRTEPGLIYDTYTGDVRGQNNQQALPPGMTKQVGTANGKPVYEDANGKRFQ